jgi:DNA recombination protein RmuC
MQELSSPVFFIVGAFVTVLLAVVIGTALSRFFLKSNQSATSPLSDNVSEEVSQALLGERLQVLVREQEHLKANLRKLEEELSLNQKELSLAKQDKSALLAHLDAEKEAHQQTRLERTGESQSHDLTKERLNNSNTALAELRVQLEHEQSSSFEKISLLLQAKESLTDQFKNLAQEILEEKSKKFSDDNHQRLSQLLDPLKTKITEFQAKVEDVYVKEGKDRSALAEQVKQLVTLNQNLSEEAKNLTNALKGSSKTQGNWGELVLERVLEGSGLRKGEEYVVQVSQSREDGSKAQADVVIHLPEERSLVVDSKVSLNAYDEFASSEDQEIKRLAEKKHVESVRNHIKELSSKNYQVLYGVKSLDFVLMFIPIEPAFMLAISSDKEIFMDAWKKNVLLVSPSTLLFVVRTVAHLWRQEAQSKNAQDIANRGAELFDKLVGFVEDLDALGVKLKQAQGSFDNAYNKLSQGKGNVIRQAQMLKTLGVKPTKNLSPTLTQKLDIQAHDEEELGLVKVKDSPSMGAQL